MTYEWKIGSEDWCLNERRWGTRGVVHACLQLLAQGAISITKCLEIMEAAILYPGTLFSEPAPWDELEWGCDGREGIREQIAMNVEALGCGCGLPYSAPKPFRVQTSSHRTDCPLSIAAAIREGRL